MTIPTIVPLSCCGGIYAHKSTCQHHRHSPDGPRDCEKCRTMCLCSGIYGAHTFGDDSCNFGPGRFRFHARYEP